MNKNEFIIKKANYLIVWVLTKQRLSNIICWNLSFFFFKFKFKFSFNIVKLKKISEKYEKFIRSNVFFNKLEKLKK